LTNIPLALNRISSHCCETRFGHVRGILRGHNQLRFWTSAEVSANLIQEFSHDLGFDQRARAHRVSEAGAKCEIIVEVPEIGTETTGESGLEPGFGRREGDQLMQRFASIDDPKRGLAALRLSAIAFARGEKGEASSLFEEFLTDRVQWLMADEQARTPSSPGVTTGVSCQARFRVIAGSVKV
jgi:hypothetical protein